mmetsp:Transcript_57864/g.62516  ORF Transcript_57864/g.62516 Transcript_57864/m.62516 type:complete len:270 (+) Transcript_57864:137-946(+)
MAIPNEQTVLTTTGQKNDDRTRTKNDTKVDHRSFLSLFYIVGTMVVGLVATLYLASSGSLANAGGSGSRSGDVQASTIVSIDVFKDSTTSTGEDAVTLMGPNADNCQSTYDNGGSGCGGDGDLWNEGSCTPFPFRGPTGSQSPSQDFCNSDAVQNYAGADWKTGKDASDSFAVWYDGGENYWIIHGCDGSGIQAGDCQGGTGYIEQIGPYSSYYADNTNGVWNGNVVNLDDDTGDPYMGSHVETVFQHPGTNKVYTWAAAGMWTTGGSE